MYRALCSVVADILDIYQEEGRWPDVKELQQEELPPFARQFLPGGLKGYTWAEHVGAGRVDYFGVNSQLPDAKNKVSDPLTDSFVLRIIDLQEPGHPFPFAESDRESQRRFAWQVWIYPGHTSYPSSGDLISSGWKWILNAADISEGKGKNVVESPEPLARNSSQSRGK